MYTIQQVFRVKHLWGISAPELEILAVLWLCTNLKLYLDILVADIQTAPAVSS